MALDPKAEEKKQAAQEDMQAIQTRPIAFKGPSPEVLAKLQAIKQELMSDFQQRETWRQNYDSMFAEIYRLYMSSSTVSKTATRSKTFIPKVYSKIEEAMPRLTGFITSEESLFDVVAKDIKDKLQVQIASNVKDLIKDQLTHADFQTKYIDFAKQLLMYGTSYMFVDWHVRREHVWERTPNRKPIYSAGQQVGEELTWTEKKTFRVTERRPNVKILDVLDVFPAENQQSVEDDCGVFIRSWKSKKEFKAMYSGRFPTYSPITGPMAMSAANSKDKESRQLRKAYRGEQGSVRSDKVELLEFWGKYDLDGDGIREECLITIANRQHVVRAIPNPFYHQKRPLLKVNFVPVPLEWFGIGLIEPVIPLQHELNSLRRMRMDNVEQLINSMWKVLSTSDVDLSQLVSTPNGIILVGEMGDVQAMDQQDVTQSAYTDAKIISDDIDEATVPPILSGTADALGRTKAGVRTALGQAMEKFSVAARSIENSGVKKMINLFYQLDLQFLDSDKVIQDTYGYLFPNKPTPEDIRGNVEIKINVISAAVAKEEKVNRALAYYTSFKGDLTNETKQTIAKEVWSLLGWDPDDITTQTMAAAMPGLPTPTGVDLTGNTDVADSFTPPGGVQSAIPDASQ